MVTAIQDMLNAFKGKDPKEIEKKLATIAKDRREQEALDNALQTCSGRGLTGDNFWTCTAVEFSANLNKAPRIESPTIPLPPSVE